MNEIIQPLSRQARIYIAGHRGLVGSALVRHLQQHGFENLLTRTRQELDLTQQNAVNEFFRVEQPEYVFLAAAKVGGIYANETYPADFIRENLQIQTHVIDAAYQNKVKKFLFLGSSCIYPKFAPQPIKEESLLTGMLEPTNEGYAVAKIAGIKMCQAYKRQYGFNAISLMPCNLYGIEDNFHLNHSHVLPAFIRKFHEAKSQRMPSVTVWGTGTPRREFLYVDDLAQAVLFLMERYHEEEIINVSVGKDISILELARLVKEIVGYSGTINFDSTKPDGTPQKLLDPSRINQLGWQAQTSLREGITLTYHWFLEHQEYFRQ